jgi:phosphoenolpyruvate carboxykinase (GTP)
MTSKNRGVDIIAEIGGIHDNQAAMALFQEKLDSTHLTRLQQITHPAININIANAIAMCEPEAVFINTGTEADREFIRAMALSKAEEEPLPMPDHTIHLRPQTGAGAHH